MGEKKTTLLFGAKISLFNWKLMVNWEKITDFEMQTIEVLYKLSADKQKFPLGWSFLDKQV